MTSVALVLLLKQIFLRPWPASYNWILNDLLRTAICSLSARQKNSWVHVSRLKNNTVVFRFLLLLAEADDADCCLLLLKKLVDLARAWNCGYHNLTFIFDGNYTPYASYKIWWLTISEIYSSFSSIRKKLSYRGHVHLNPSIKYASRCWAKRKWLHVCEKNHFFKFERIE